MKITQETKITIKLNPAEKVMVNDFFSLVDKIYSKAENFSMDYIMEKLVNLDQLNEDKIILRKEKSD